MCNIQYCIRSLFLYPSPIFLQDSQNERLREPNYFNLTNAHILNLRRIQCASDFCPIVCESEMYEIEEYLVLCPKKLTLTTVQCPT